MLCIQAKNISHGFLMFMFCSSESDLKDWFSGKLTYIHLLTLMPNYLPKTFITMKAYSMITYWSELNQHWTWAK